MALGIVRRGAVAAAAGVLGFGALVATAGDAAAADYVPIDVGHWVGLYTYPNTSQKAGWADVPPGGEIIAQCWTVGESIGNYGNTWYRTNQIFWSNGRGWATVSSNVYVFAGYADGNARTVDRDPDIHRC
ncbi:hypothetical protein [Kitasatospora sp. NPDC088134]|uniref:hypothetical protein n=1 Tax=Kitasatospora sp. NPDC088134 TaxID=3364071 RepID=UPI0038266984